MDVKAVMKELTRFALAFPGAVEDHPWGETVAKVNKKVFAFLGHPDYHKEHGYGFSVKLPGSSKVVLESKHCEPTGYGLGKSGWVTVNLGQGESPFPVDELKTWIEESYRSIAPLKLVYALNAQQGLDKDGNPLTGDEPAAPPAPKKKRAAKKATAKERAPKKKPKK